MLHLLRSSLFGLSLPFLLLSPASAAIVMFIDADNEQLRFTGTDTGLADLVGSDYTVTFSNSQPQGLLLEGNSVSDALTNPFNNAFLLSGTDGLVELDFHQTSDPGTVTLTGTGEWFSYSTYNSEQRGWISGLVGTTLPLTVGSGFSDISVIPEPTSAALILGALGLAGLRRRR